MYANAFVLFTVGRRSTSTRVTPLFLTNIFKSTAVFLATATGVSASTPPVPVLVCTEALCPGCEAFVSGDLYPAFQAVGDIMNLTFVPYGNTKIDLDTQTVTCQHGEEECSANTYEQCAIYKNPATADHLPFINCLASKNSALLNLDSTFEKCAEKASLDFYQIKACHDDEDLAWQLQRQVSSNSSLTASSTVLTRSPLSSPTSPQITTSTPPGSSSTMSSTKEKTFSETSARLTWPMAALPPLAAPSPRRSGALKSRKHQYLNS